MKKKTGDTPRSAAESKRKKNKYQKKSKSITGNRLNRSFSRLKSRFLLPSFLKEMQDLKIGGLSGGNSVKIISDGDECFREYISAIKSAKSSINIEVYIFKSDEVGWMIAELLVKKAESGININLIYDAVGCMGTSPSIFSFMQKGGVEVLEYHPLMPWGWFKNINLRDHRKLLVIDGKLAFLGGMNIGQEYAGRAFNGGQWRDTQLRIEGPAVRDIQFLFFEIWFRNGGAMVDPGKHFPNIEEPGKTIVMIIGSKSKKKIKPVKETYLSAIKYARESIFITNAYFIPDAKFYRAFVRAARRGVDVRLLLPGKSDLPFVQYASMYLYKRYLKSGIRIFEYTASVLHAKTAVIDGVWSTVGSSNIDRISFTRNLEINAVILNQEFGEGMEDLFALDLENSVELKLENWQKRSMLHLAREWFCYRFRNLF